jgi:hypothetical protein
LRNAVLDAALNLFNNVTLRNDVIAASSGAEFAYAGTAMLEWLILTLLVPAIVVPAVLLLGFAGCGFYISAGGLIFESAVPKDYSTITLTWTQPAEVRFERTKEGATEAVLFDAFFSSPSDVTGRYDDPDLDAATTYSYVMRSLLADGEVGQTATAAVSATTPAFFALDQVAQNDNFGNVNTHTVKCEIAIADLLVPPFAPTRMWITLGQRSTTTENITFSKVYIGHKAATGNPSDATSLTQVLFGGAASVVVMPPTPTMPANSVRSDEISFPWDRTTALILSMSFAGGPNSDQLSAKTGSNSTTHLKNSVDEAATPISPGYTAFPGFLSGVIKIEVA